MALVRELIPLALKRVADLGDLLAEVHALLQNKNVDTFLQSLPLEIFQLLRVGDVLEVGEDFTARGTEEKPFEAHGFLLVDGPRDVPD